jgi:hypothetical protein
MKSPGGVLFGDKVWVQIQVNAATLVVYVDGSGFTRHGTSSYWHLGNGYGLHGNMIWTYNNRSFVDNSGDWTPNLPADSNYEVFVYIPRNHGTTKHAEYTIYTANGVVGVSINQYNYNDQWVSLGTYSFHAGTGGYLHLVDQTGENDTSTQIGFDAAEWVQR